MQKEIKQQVLKVQMENTEIPSMPMKENGTILEIHWDFSRENGICCQDCTTGKETPRDMSWGRKKVQI